MILLLAGGAVLVLLVIAGLARSSSREMPKPPKRDR